MIQIEHASHFRAGMVRTNPGGSKRFNEYPTYPNCRPATLNSDSTSVLPGSLAQNAIALKALSYSGKPISNKPLNFRIAGDPGVRTIARELQETA